MNDYDLYDTNSFYKILFKEIITVENKGTRLTINHSLSIDVNSSRFADRMAKNILFLKKTPSGNRLEKIKSIFEYKTELKELNKISLKSTKLFPIIESLSAFLFVTIFALIPAGLYFEKTLFLKLLIISTATVYSLIIILTYWNLQRRFKLSKESVEILMHLILFPVSAIHIVKNLTQHSLSSLNFVTLSAAFLSQNELKTVLRKELKRIHYSKMKCIDNEFNTSLKLKEEYLNRFLPNAGLTPDNIFEQPGRQDINASGYCPLCEIEFVEGFKICPDCNMKLERFKH